MSEADDLIVLLTDGLPGTLRTRADVSPSAGRLFTPRHVNALAETVAAGVPFAADNDAFNGFDVDRWRAMLGKLAPFAASCSWAAVPDVVGDAAGTFAQWRRFAPELRAQGFSAALVLQDGMTAGPGGVWHGADVVEWRELGAVFVGGSDGFKLGPEARRIVAAARAAGKLAHVGRVNSRKRLMHAAAIGATSVDGSGWVKFRDSMMPRLRGWEQDGRPAALLPSAA